MWPAVPGCEDGVHVGYSPTRSQDTVSTLHKHVLLSLHSTLSASLAKIWNFPPIIKKVAVSNKHTRLNNYTVF